MAKIPKDPKEIFEEIVNDYRGLFGDDLLSIILYGSATGVDYRPGRSDINFMILLSERGIENLDRAFDIVSKWKKRKVAVPLFLTEIYVETSTDVFPIEYMNFKRKHALVYGKDILEDLSFNPELVRLQCEREIKGKLLLLRQSFLESGGKGRVLKGVIGQSIETFLAIFDGLLFLKGEKIPEEKRKVIYAASEAFHMDSELLIKLLDIKQEKVKLSEAEMKAVFKDYLKEVLKLSRAVDTFGG